MNISSIIIKTLPQNLKKVEENIKQLNYCEFHFSDEKGYIIVTIEGLSVEEELKKIKLLERLPLVISASMQMSYSEDELNKNIEILNNQEIVPKNLNDKNIKPQDMKYSGSLKNKF